jgi:mannobiose 2-epimerase
MEYYVERLNHELTNIMRFWQEHVICDGKIATQIANDGTAEFTAPTGCIYISRILYGSSAACNHLKKYDYKYIADLAYQTLRTKLNNPYGGYYWATDEQGNIIHDDYYSSVAQAFVISGLAEYYALTKEPEIKMN